MLESYFDFMEKNPELFVNSESASVEVLTDMEKMVQIQEKSGRELGIVYEDDYISLLRDAVRFPNESEGTYIRIVPKNGECAVVILPIIGDKILLTKHFRHSTRKVYLEVPRGFGEKGKSAEEMAGKELFEETGLIVERMQFLGKCAPDTGLLASEVSVYLAELEKGDARNLDGQEAISGYTMLSAEEMKKKIREGQILDGFTLNAWALYMALYG